MACTFDISTDRGKVRWIVGDTSTTACVFPDTEIDAALTMNSGNINLAAADVLAAWMAKYTLSPEAEKIGDYSYTNKVIEKMNKLMKELREKDASTPYQTYGSFDLTGIEDTSVEED